MAKQKAVTETRLAPELMLEVCRALNYYHV